MKHNQSTNNVITNQYSLQDFDSACSTPFVSAPSSPGRSAAGGGGAAAFFYSAPTSPMHYLFSHSHLIQQQPSSSSSTDVVDIQDFDFYSTKKISSMTSADELFFNGKIRATKLTDVAEEEAFDDDQNSAVMARGRRNMSLRRIRSLSPVRNEGKLENPAEHGSVTAASGGDTAAREDDAPAGGGRGSRRWVSLKEFLYRSKSEGRNNGRHKYFWSFKEKDRKVATTTVVAEKGKEGAVVGGRRRVGLSAHEVHYTANRAVAEEMRRKTFLPYRQGLLGCLGFNFKGYGAMNGFTKALNSVSSS